jgi:hypothetical protein
MSQVIIYKQDNGVVSVIVPTPDAVATHGITSIARKDVPIGKYFKIMDSADLPTDFTFRDAWTVADDALTDGQGIGHDAWTAQQEQVA